MTLAAPLLHGFGLRYDLPIPLALFMYAAGGVVVASFMLVAVFAGSRAGDRAVTYPRLEVRWLAALLRSGAPRGVAGAVGVLVLLAVIVSGYFGSADSGDNPAEYLVWIYFWAALVIVSGLVGNLYAGFNPWSALYDLLTLGRRRGRARHLPDRLGIWPAVAGYWLFAGFELASQRANHPTWVASAAVAYTAYTLAGMFAFGRDQWLRRCEMFSVLFDLVGRFGPVEVERDEAGRVESAHLRPWGMGLLRPFQEGTDWIVFVILTLSSLAFDGISATAPWSAFQAALAPDVHDTLRVAAVRFFLGLSLVTIVFLLIYLGVMRLVVAFGRGRDRLATTTLFVFTLVPIALVYNFAHNYGYVLVQAQGLFPLLNDPLQRGWRLAPQLAGYEPSAALAGAATVWYMQVVLIVVGHVIAVWLSHLRAGERFRSARRALLSQYPMLALMVAYTMTSLWILAQPTTSGG